MLEGAAEEPPPCDGREANPEEPGTVMMTPASPAELSEQTLSEEELAEGSTDLEKAGLNLDKLDCAATSSAPGNSCHTVSGPVAGVGGDAVAVAASEPVSTAECPAETGQASWSHDFKCGATTQLTPSQPSTQLTPSQLTSTRSRTRWSGLKHCLCR